MNESIQNVGYRAEVRVVSKASLPKIFSKEDLNYSNCKIMSVKNVT